MAILQMHYFSQALFRTVSVNVILPADKSVDGAYLRRERPFKTLYLLHGYCGNHTDWVNYTRIQHWAEDRNLAVVMPSGENAFYVDHPYGSFGELVGRELVEITRRMFPLSPRREDTFLAGLSMGGYGAMRNGLKYWQTFGAIGAFSSALHYFELPPDTPGLGLKNENALFGNLRQAALTDQNPRVAYEAMEAGCRETRLPLPRIYMACGTEDELLPSNRSFRDFLVEKGAALTYTETPGAHNWDFWNEHILRFLDWLPLEDVNPGTGSGNVK